MTQLSLLDYRPPTPRGETFDKARDGKRLCEQALRVFDVMRDGKPRTLRQIAIETGAPEASASARLRDIRAAGYTVDRAYVGGGLHEYTVKA